MKKSNQNKIIYPAWCWVIFGLLNSIFLLGDEFFALIWFLMIFFICKPHFERWATELNKSPATPFILVCLAGLVGQLCYWIYYIASRKK